MAARVQEQLSPDGRYKLVLKTIVTGENTWSHLEVEVRRTSDDALIGVTTRNYGNPSVYHFIRQDEVDYLVLSENYHGGYGVMNLATGEKAVYDPETEDHEEGTQFWCWAAGASHDPVKKELVIDGCYWAWPYELRTFDFSSPMSPPYPLLKVEELPEDDGDEESAETPTASSPA